MPIVTQSWHACVYILLDPSAPVVPIGVSIARKHAQEVGISWTVPGVSYTQEIYIIEYGSSPDELMLTSDSVLGSTDITLTNQLYSLSLVDLQDNTTYFYKIIADNSFFMTETVVDSFTTPPLCKFKFLVHTQLY